MKRPALPLHLNFILVMGQSFSAFTFSMPLGQLFFYGEFPNRFAIELLGFGSMWIVLCYAVFSLRSKPIFSNYQAAIAERYLPSKMATRFVLWLLLFLTTSAATKIAKFNGLLAIAGGVTSIVFSFFMLFFDFYQDLPKKVDEFEEFQTREIAQISKIVLRTFCLVGICVCAIGSNWGNFQVFREALALGFIMTMVFETLAWIISSYFVENKYKIRPQEEYE